MRKHRTPSFAGRAEEILNGSKTRVELHLHLPAPTCADSKRATEIVERAWNDECVIECPHYLYARIKRLLPQAFVKEFIGKNDRTLCIITPDRVMRSAIWARFGK